MDSCISIISTDNWKGKYVWKEKESDCNPYFYPSFKLLQLKIINYFCNATRISFSHHTTLANLFYKALFSWQLNVFYTNKKYQNVIFQTFLTLMLLQQSLSQFYLGINHCAESPCKNGGRCLDLNNGHYCACSVGWTGENCTASEDQFFILLFLYIQADWRSVFPDSISM